MRRLSAAATLALITGCASRHQAIGFDDAATVLNIFDPRADKQLLKGFFPLEPMGRWTTRSFSVMLKPPPNAARKGALLRLRFEIAEQSINVLHTIRVSAAVNGVALLPQAFVKPGEWDYVQDVPASAFRGVDSRTVDFALDKALPQFGSERRELGVIANTIGFEAK